MKDGTYKLNLNEYKSIKTHWVAFSANGNSSKYLMLNTFHNKSRDLLTTKIS